MPKDNGKPGPQGRDWSHTLFLPRTNFPSDESGAS